MIEGAAPEGGRFSGRSSFPEGDGPERAGPMHGTKTGGGGGPRLRMTASSALALTTIIINLVRIVGTMCLTRLLSPAVYGVTGTIMTAFYTINMVTDIGLQAYIVRHKESDDPNFLSAVFTMHAVRGVVLAAIGALASWPLALVLGKPEVATPLAISSLIFVLDGLISLHQFRGLRDGKVQRFSLIEFVTSISQTLSAIALAFLLRNVWAIVGSMFIASALRLWAGYALFPGSTHKFRTDRKIASDLWRFSRVIAVSSALTLVITLVDKLVMARILTLSQFGIYVIAASLASAPTVFTSSYAAAIVYPSVAAAWREGTSIRNAYYQNWGRFFYSYAFGGGVLIGIADLVVRLLYDPRYQTAAQYLSILAIGTAFMMLTRSIESAQIASGRQKFAIESNILRLVVLITGGLLSSFSGNAVDLLVALGLIEPFVYLLGILKMTRLQQVNWTRELSVLTTIAVGFAAGKFASISGHFLFPRT